VIGHKIVSLCSDFLRMKLKSDLYTANGTRELIVTDQIYNSIQFEEEKTTSNDPGSATKKLKVDKKTPGKEETRRKRTKRLSDKTAKDKKSRSAVRGKEVRPVKSRQAKSDSSVLTELTSVKSSKLSSR
jgi:hypothetical protein